MAKCVADKFPFCARAEYGGSKQLRRRKRNRPKLSVYKDVAGSARVGNEKFRLESDVLDHFEQRIRGEKALRACLEDAGVANGRANVSAGPVGLLEHEDRDTCLAEIVSTAESGDAAADDQNAGRGLYGSRRHGGMTQRVFEKSGLDSICCFSR